MRFLRASIKGWQWSVQHPDQAGRISYQHSLASSPGGVRHQIYMAREVAKRFEGNFKKFESHVGDKVNQAAIRAAV